MDIDNKISVIMSVYKEEALWVQQAVDSIRSQTYKNLECIIVIDNPQIEMPVEEYLNNVEGTDIRFKIIHNKTNMGLPACLNLALSHANGRYIARMDADDISYPTRLEKELAFLVKEQVDLVSCCVRKIDESGCQLAAQVNDAGEVAAMLPYSNPVKHPGVLMRADAVRKLGGYRNFKSSQDYDLWLRFLSAGYRIRVIDEVLLDYRVRKTSISNEKAAEQFYAAKYARKLYRMRLRAGKDDFTQENYERHVNKRARSDQKSLRMAKSKQELAAGKSAARSHPLTGMLHFARSFALSPDFFCTKMWQYNHVSSIRKKRDQANPRRKWHLYG